MHVAVPHEPGGSPDAFAAPAQDLEAERNLLGAMILSAAALREARGLLSTRHFYRQAHALIFEALLALEEKGTPPDIVQLAEELRRRGNLEVVGGASAIAALIESPVAAANLAPTARIVRERAVRRAAAAQGLRLVELAKDPTRPIADQLQEHRKAVRAIVDDHGAIDRRAWMQQILTLRELVNTEFEPMQSIVGNQVLTCGAYAQLAGHSSLGKTFLTIQLAGAIIEGREFLGQETQLPSPRPRVAMLEFEMPWTAMQARARNHGLNVEAIGSGIEFLCMPKGTWYLTDQDVIERIVDWCGEKMLGMLVIDPLNRVRRGDASDAQVCSEWLDAVHQIIERTGVTLLFVNHVRKTFGEQRGASRTTTASLDSIKGDSRYVDDADSVFILDEVVDGTERLIRFEWAKTRFGKQPPSVYLKRNSTGFFDMVDSPSAKKQAERQDAQDRTIQILRDAWTEGVRLELVMAELGLPNTDKARRMILQVGGVPRGSTRDRKYFHPECIDELEPELPMEGGL